jgi:hypothetical protein
VAVTVKSFRDDVPSTNLGNISDIFQGLVKEWVTRMKIRKVGPAFLILMIPLLAGGCRGNGSQWKGTSEKIEGVMTVKNPKMPLFELSENAFTLSREMVLGGKEGSADYMFSQIQDVDVDPQGNIFVLDQRETQVKVFNARGEYLRTIGRRGQGPGELQMPVLVQITKQNELLVYDYAMARANLYSPEGIFLRQRSSRTPLFPLAMDSRGCLVGFEILAPPPMGGKRLMRYNPELQQAELVAQDKQGQPAAFDIGKPTVHACVAPNDVLVWGNSKDYVLYFVNPAGKIFRIVQRDYDPVPISSADRKEYEEKLAGPVRHGMSLKFRDYYPAFSMISSDEQGRIFVKTYESMEGANGRNIFDIYDPEGRYLTRAMIPANLNEYSAWEKDRLYTIEMDDQDYPAIVRYRIAWSRR